MSAIRKPARLAALVIVGCAAHARAAAAEVTADWVGPSQGIWHDPANWSTQPDYPNNGTPAGTSYDVRLAPAFPARVILETDVTVDNVTVGAGSTLAVYSFARLGIVDTVHVADGAVLQLHGTLAGGTLTTAGTGRVDTPLNTGTLRDVFIDGELGSASGGWGYTFLGDTRLGPRGVVHLANDIDDLTVYTPGLLGTGQVVFDPGAGSQTSIRTEAERLYIGPEITVRTAAQGWGSIGGRQFVNDGRLLAETQGGRLFLGGTGAVFTNRGTVSVANGGAIDIGGDWSNTGTISVDHGTVYLERIPAAAARGQFRVRDGTLLLNRTTPAAVRALDVTGSVLSAADLDNTNNVLDVRDGTNTWRVRAGVLRGGTVTSTAGAPLVTSGQSEFRDVVLDADVHVTPGGQLRMTGTTRVAGHDVRLDSGPVPDNPFTGSSLTVGSEQMLGAGTRVIFDGARVNTLRRGDRTGFSVPAGVQVVTGAGGGAIEGGAITNAGRIAAVTPGKAITFSTAQSIINRGVLEAGDGDLEAPGVPQQQGGPRVPVPLSNEGTIRLGVGGDLRVGSVAQFPSARVDVVLGGAGEEQLGQAHATGEFRFAGILGVEAASGYSVLPGRAFEIVTYGSRAGSFDSIVNNTGLAGLTFTPVYDADSLTLVSGALAGDANLDGRVNATDLLVLRRHFGRSGVDWTGGDFDGNGRANARDLILLRQNYGTALPTATAAALGSSAPGSFAAVPDPSGAFVLLATGVLMTRRVRRNRHNEIRPER